MTITYPIIETQLRLIRALQKGYIEALEAGDWQAADYRCSHLHKLCEGLYHLSQLLDKESSLPSTTKPKSTTNNWVTGIRASEAARTLNHSSEVADKPVGSPPPLPDPGRYIWSGGSQSLQPPIDEVWQ